MLSWFSSSCSRLWFIICSFFLLIMCSSFTHHLLRANMWVQRYFTGDPDSLPTLSWSWATFTGDGAGWLGWDRRHTYLGKLLPSLKLTAKAPENGWLEYDRVTFGFTYFQGLWLFVLGRVSFPNLNFLRVFCGDSSTITNMPRVDYHQLWSH